MPDEQMIEEREERADVVMVKIYPQGRMGGQVSVFKDWKGLGGGFVWHSAAVSWSSLGGVDAGTAEAWASAIQRAVAVAHELDEAYPPGSPIPVPS